MKTAILSLLPILLRAQTPDATPPPTFDVVSVKPTLGQPINSGFRRAAGGVLNATNVSVRFLMQWAYDLREDQVTGGAPWIDSERYEILAKPAEGADISGGQKLLKLRTRSLLADRFHVTFHRETKELPIYVLTLARNGPKGLRESTAATSPDFINNGHHLNCQRVSMAMLAHAFLANQIGRSVIDKTGITGDFDFTLDWSADDPPADTATAPTQFPPLFLALQEQLGLKLEQSKGPVEVLVIGHAERPTAN